MPDQIIDRRTVAIPGPQGDVTPEALQARDDAIAARDGAEDARDAADANAAEAQQAANEAEAAQAAAEAAAFPTQVTDWNNAITAGERWAFQGAANEPVPGTGLVHAGEVYTMPFQGTTLVWQVVRYGGARPAEQWTRYKNANDEWSTWSAAGGDTGWVDLSGYLRNAFPGGMAGRAIGNVVEISGNINGTLPNAVVSTDFSVAIPAAFRPSGRSRLGPAYAGAFIGGVVVRSDGTMAIANRTGQDWSDALFSVTYFRG